MELTIRDIEKANLKSEDLVKDSRLRVLITRNVQSEFAMPQGTEVLTMNKDILLVAESVSNEKGVSKEVIFEAIEALWLLLPLELFQKKLNSRGDRS